MALEKITEAQMDANGVIAAPDILNGSPAANKLIFDRMIRNLVAPAYNACVDAVNALEGETEKINKMTVEAETLPPGSEATTEIAIDAETGGLNIKLGIPRGEDGAAGKDGLPGRDALNYLPVIEGDDVPDGVEAWIDPSVESAQPGEGGGGGKEEVYVGPDKPTNGEEIWVNPDDEEGDFYTKEETETLVDEKIAAIPTGVQMELLWENASPTSAFAAQTIPLDLSSFSFLAFETDWVPNDPYTQDLIIRPVNFQKPGMMINIGDHANNSRARHFSLSENGISFEGGYGSDSYLGTDVQNDSYCVPLKIYGIKGVR